MKAKDNIQELTATEKVAGKVEGFFSKNGKLVAIIAAAVIVIVIAIGIIVTVAGNSAEKKFEAIAKLDSQYTALTAMDETTDEYRTAVDQFLSDADALIASSKDYPGIKASYLKGLYEFSQKNYSAAASIFEAVSVSAKGSYLGSLSLINGAAAYENAGDQAKALEFYNKVWDDYGKNAAPRHSSTLEESTRRRVIRNLQRQLISSSSMNSVQQESTPSSLLPELWYYNTSTVMK